MQKVLDERNDCMRVLQKAVDEKTKQVDDLQDEKDERDKSFKKMMADLNSVVMEKM